MNNGKPKENHKLACLAIKSLKQPVGGAPTRKRSYRTYQGKEETWYYEDSGYISLKNGKVISISQ